MKTAPGVKFNKNHISLDLWYEMSVHNLKTGKRTRHKKGRCYSFVGNFVVLLNHAMRGTGTRTGYTDVNGNVRPESSGLYSSYTGNNVLGDLVAPVNNDGYGVLVGTDSTAATISDYQLAAQVAHGTSTGELQHGAVSFGAPTTLVGMTTFQVTRVFTNGSGAGITIREIGMAVTNTINQNSDRVLIARDVVTDTLVPNGEALTLNYTFRTDV